MFPWGVATVVVAFPWGVGVNVVLDGGLGDVERWVLYGCGQGSGVSTRPRSVAGFDVLMFCMVGAEG